MKADSRCLLLSGAVFILICTVISVNGGRGGGGKKWMAMFKKCGESEINVEEAMKGKKECMQEMMAKKGGESRRKRSPDEGQGKSRGRGKGRGKWKKNSCVAVCQFKKNGLLDESGKFSETGADAYVKKVYPEKFQSKMIENLKTCASENSSTFSMDDNCKGYKGFQKCTWKSHKKTCMPGKGKGQGENKTPPPPPAEEEEE